MLRTLHSARLVAGVPAAQCIAELFLQEAILHPTSIRQTLRVPALNRPKEGLAHSPGGAQPGEISLVPDPCTVIA